MRLFPSRLSRAISAVKTDQRTWLFSILTSLVNFSHTCSAFFNNS